MNNVPHGTMQTAFLFQMLNMTTLQILLKNGSATIVALFVQIRSTGGRIKEKTKYLLPFLPHTKVS